VPLEARETLLPCELCSQVALGLPVPPGAIGALALGGGTAPAKADARPPTLDLPQC